MVKNNKTHIKKQKKDFQEAHILVINYSFRGTTWGFANLLELCAFKNLGDVCVSLNLIALFLSRSQVTANEAKARLVQ